MDNPYGRYIPYNNFVANKFNNSNINKVYFSEASEYGYVDVKVYRYILRTPIENATIRVSKLTISGTYKEIGLGKFLATLNTDKNGAVNSIKLPVLKNDNEMYILAIMADGFNNAYVFDVPIYPNITTSYNIYLRGLQFEGDPDYEFIL